MVQRSAHCAFQSLPAPASLLLHVARHPSARDSRATALSHCVAAHAPNFGWLRVFVAQATARTRFVATSKRNGAVAAMAWCGVFRRTPRLQSHVKDIRRRPCDYRVVDTAHPARSDSTAADRA